MGYIGVIIHLVTSWDIQVPQKQGSNRFGHKKTNTILAEDLDMAFFKISNPSRCKQQKQTVINTRFKTSPVI